MKPVTNETAEKILDAVFTPLKETNQEPPKPKSSRFDFISEKRPPTVKVSTTTTDDLGIVASIVGFEDVDRWGKINHPLWSAASRQAEHINMTEVDRLKFLSANLLATCVELQAHLVQAMRTSGNVPSTEPPKGKA